MFYIQEERVTNLKGPDGNEPTEDSNLLTGGEKKPQDSPAEPSSLQSPRRFLACPPHGRLAGVITNGVCTAVGMNSENDQRGCHSESFRSHVVKKTTRNLPVLS